MKSRTTAIIPHISISAAHRGFVGNIYEKWMQSSEQGEANKVVLSLNIKRGKGR